MGFEFSGRKFKLDNTHVKANIILQPKLITKAIKDGHKGKSGKIGVLKQTKEETPAPRKSGKVEVLK